MTNLVFEMNTLFTIFNDEMTWEYCFFDPTRFLNCFLNRFLFEKYQTGIFLIIF
jgi:hypothetical protein